MTIAIDIIISLFLICYNSYEMVRIFFFRIDKNSLFTGLTSMVSIVFGLYLFVKNGLILDYGTQAEISTNWAGQIWFLGVMCIFIGLGFILSSILKYILSTIKRKKKNE